MSLKHKKWHYDEFIFEALSLTRLKFHFVYIFSVVKFIILLKCLYFVVWQRQICIKFMSTSGKISTWFFFYSFQTTSAATNGKKSSINFLFAYFSIYLTNSSAHFKFNNLSKLCKKRAHFNWCFIFVFFRVKNGRALERIAELQNEHFGQGEREQHTQRKKERERKRALYL